MVGRWVGRREDKVGIRCRSDRVEGRGAGGYEQGERGIR